MDDYIRRQAAIDALSAHKKDLLYIMDKCGVTEEVNKTIEIIRNVPSADVQPVRHGHWEKIGKPTWWGLYECSECHKTCSVDHTYCPHCGSIMKEKKNDGMDTMQ